ncbi:MAG: hypothetical protein ACXV8P_02035, partial [Methylobacter sp.]
YYAYPPYYASPAVIRPSVPTVYIDQGTAQIQPFELNHWNYCSNPQGYYPHVKECPVGWLSLDPQPEGQESGYWYYCTNPAGYYPYVRQCSTLWQKVVP